MNVKSNVVIRALAEYLENRGFIKMNPYLYIKNIRTDTVTGGVIMVDFKRAAMSVITVEDKFLWFRKKPRIRLAEKHYGSLKEFKKYMQENERAEVDYMKCEIDWNRRSK